MWTVSRSVLRAARLGLGLVVSLLLVSGCASDVTATPTPVALAGPDVQTSIGGVVTLDGSASNVPGVANAKLTYQWSIASPDGVGSAVTLDTPSAAKTKFKSTKDGLFVVQLVVTYAGTASEPAYVDVTVSKTNMPPIANAGPDQTVDPGSTVTLDGTASSDPGGGPVTYAWTEVTGPAVTLSDPTAAQPTFVAPGPPGLMVFSLYVTDAAGARSLTDDRVTISIRDVKPVAVIVAPPSANESTTVTLDGTTSSDANGQAITAYAWTLTSDLGITLSDTTAPQPTFDVPRFCGPNESVVVTLVVTAGGQQSAPASVTIPLNDVVNENPTVDAGTGGSVDENVDVTLTGAASDCNGDSLTYQWAQTAGPAVTIVNPTSLTATFHTPQIFVATTLTFTLTADDGNGGTATASVTYTEQNTVNEPPTADAGTPQTVAVQTTVTLDGSASSDPNGDPLGYTWTQTSGTAVTLQNPATATPSFTAPSAPATLVFQLVVDDGSLSSTPATVTITVTPGAPDLTASTITTADPRLVADGISTTTVTVTVVDSVGNPVPGRTVVISASVGSLPTTVVDHGDGTYTETYQSPTSTATPATLTFTVDGAGNPANNAVINFDPGPPSGFIVLAANPAQIVADGTSTTTISTPSGSPITDAHGNVVTDGTQVSVSTNRGTLSASTVTTTSGVISFTLTSSITAGSATVQASSVTGTASGSVAVPFVPGPPDSVTLSPSPAQMTADGTSVSTVTSTVVTDVNGNQIPQGVLITVSATGSTGVHVDPADDVDPAPGVQVAVSAAGTITFHVVAGTQATTVTVTAANSGGTTIGQTTITLQAGPPDGSFTLGATPGTVKVTGGGTPTSTTVTSGTITDANGNTVQDGTPVTISVTNGCSVAGGNTVTTSGGTVTFTVQNCTTTGTATITATASATSQGSTTITVQAGPPAQLVFTVQPSTANSRAPITPAIEVQIEDALGNAAVTATNSVSLAIGTDPSGGTATLSGGGAVAAVGGVATFPSVSIDTAGTGYTLVASSTGLTSGTSNAFDITACTISAAVTASEANAFPGDTVTLDASTSATCNRAITYTWSATTSPAGAGNGFPPYGTFSAGASGVQTPFYVDDVNGSYTLQVSMNDGVQTSTASVSVAVSGFTLATYSTLRSSGALDSRAIAVDTANGNVYIGTQAGGTGQSQVYLASRGRIYDLGCLSAGNHSHAVAIDANGRALVSYDDDRHVERIDSLSYTTAGGLSCSVTSLDPGTIAATTPTKTRDLAVSGNTFYMTTDHGVFYFNAFAFTTEYAFTDLGGTQDYSGAVFDGQGDLWFGSNHGTPVDGAIETTVPPTNSSPLLSYLSGDDKIRTFVSPLSGVGPQGELWMGTDGNGILQVADVKGAPGTAVQYSVAGGQIPAGANDHVRRGAMEPVSDDVWFATQTAIVRYKRDVSAFFVMPDTANGLAAGGQMYDVAFDEGNGRGRIAIIATKNGVYYLYTP